MNKKQFLLLSLLACTVVSQSTTQAVVSRLRTVAKTTFAFASLLAGGYASAGIIIGSNNKNIPILNNEKSLSTEQQAQRADKRENPYNAAFKELNSMIIDDCIRLGNAVTDKSALEKTIKDAYATLAAAAQKALNKIKDLNSKKPTPRSEDDDTEDAE